MTVQNNCLKTIIVHAWSVARSVVVNNFIWKVCLRLKSYINLYEVNKTIHNTAHFNFTGRRNKDFLPTCINIHELFVCTHLYMKSISNGIQFIMVRWENEIGFICMTLHVLRVYESKSFPSSIKVEKNKSTRYAKLSSLHVCFFVHLKMIILLNWLSKVKCIHVHI